MPARSFDSSADRRRIEERRRRQQEEHHGIDTGIGASVRRKEDQRFITGKGQYTDDINRPGQTYAVFRALAARACDHQEDRCRRRAGDARLLAVLTGDDIAKDKVGGLICGWMIHSKDGSPMKAGAHPALAQGKVRYVGDHVAVVIAETLAQAKDAAEKVVVDYDVLPAVGRHGDGAERRASRSPRRSAQQHGLSAGTSATRRRSTPPSPTPST